jgi:hypothetical protein
VRLYNEQLNGSGVNEMHVKYIGPTACYVAGGVLLLHGSDSPVATSSASHGWFTIMMVINFTPSFGARMNMEKQGLTQGVSPKR